MILDQTENQAGTSASVTDATTGQQLRYQQMLVLPPPVHPPVTMQARQQLALPAPPPADQVNDNQPI